MPKKENSNIKLENKTKKVVSKVPKKDSTKINSKKNSVPNNKKTTSPKARKEVSKTSEKLNKAKTEFKEKKDIATKQDKKIVKNSKKAEKVVNIKKSDKKAVDTKKSEKVIKTNKKNVDTKKIENTNKKEEKKKSINKVLERTEKLAKAIRESEKIAKNSAIKLPKINVKEEIDKDNLKVVIKKETDKVDEQTVIEKIKSFIAKIAAMQEETLKEEDNKKVKTEKTEKAVKPKTKETKKISYMLEYYDLPYRYNETVVKILAQTPKVLFVYWDISDNDRNKYIEAFGTDFFEKTYPVLLVYNEDKKYVKEVAINDFANSWYIDIEEPKTKYIIQLGRKFKGNDYNNVNTRKVQEANIILKTDYLPFASSNLLEAPNDHVLLENLPEFLIFRNVKTNQEFTKDIRNLKDVYGNSYNVKDFYNNQYKDELNEGMFDMENPSSNLSSSSFK